MTDDGGAWMKSSAGCDPPVAGDGQEVKGADEKGDALSCRVKREVGKNNNEGVGARAVLF
jgi:hypothetical protein